MGSEINTALLVNVNPKRNVNRLFCDICGNVIVAVHCKLKCTICGFVRDCSDP
jgi:hypothetical protein